MLFPIGDKNRRDAGTPVLTYTLIALNILVFVGLQGCGANETFTYGYSAVPYEITEGVDLVEDVQVEVPEGTVPIPQEPGPPLIYLTLLTSMFMHGGFMHILGNMVYLWIFGDNLEHRFGKKVFLAFYLLAGLAGTLAQIVLDADSVIPSLGASGAISGVLGGYLLLFPRNEVRAILFYFVVSVPAIVAIGLWIVFQFVNGFGAVMVAEETVGGVAYGAHIGGFFAGMALAAVLRGVVKERKSVLSEGRPYRDGPVWRY